MPGPTWTIWDELTPGYGGGNNNPYTPNPPAGNPNFIPVASGSGYLGDTGGGNPGFTPVGAGVVGYGGDEGWLIPDTPAATPQTTAPATTQSPTTQPGLLGGISTTALLVGGAVLLILAMRK